MRITPLHQSKRRCQPDLKVLEAKFKQNSPLASRRRRSSDFAEGLDKD